MPSADAALHRSSQEKLNWSRALAAALGHAASERYRAEVLISLAPQLTGELKEQCCKLRLRQRWPSRMRAIVPRCLLSLAPQLTGEQGAGASSCPGGSAGHRE